MSEIDSLILALKRGDRQAREKVIESVYPRVRALVHHKLERDFRRTNRWMFAEFSTGDIVQDVFHRVLESLDQFRGDDEDALVAYLAMAVHRRLLDQLRYHRAARRDVHQREHPMDGTHSAEGAFQSPLATPSRNVAAKEHIQIYQNVLASFPSRQRHLLRMRLEEGLAFAEIAERMDYASAEVACKAFHESKARLLVRLRAHGVKMTRDDNPEPEARP